MSRASQFRVEDAEPEEFDIDPSSVIKGPIRQSAAVLYNSEDGRTVSGIFRSSKGTFRAEQAGDEWTLVRKGHVIVTGDDGSRIECRPGDAMALEGGGVYEFEVLEDLEDYFVIHNESGVEL